VVKWINLGRAQKDADILAGAACPGKRVDPPWAKEKGANE
jgi:hypothetical protein